MHDKTAIEMMMRLRAEIFSLRNQVEYLQPKAEAYDTLRQVIGLLPKQSQRQSEDVLWIIDKEIATLKEAQQEAMKPRAANNVPKNEF